MSGVYPTGVDVRRDARLSLDGRYRYALWRDWCGMERPRWATFIMLNPSTANAEVDDPTIRRCVGFARALECTGLAVVNLYAFRATKPADLWLAEDPIGEDADSTLDEFARMAVRHGGPLIAAWGANARPARVEQALAVMDSAGARDRLTTLGLTAAGAPRHPLYLPATARPVPYGVAQ